MTTTTITATQTLSIATSLLAAGGISTLSLFDIPLLKCQPASRSLPLTRWLFSRGSHIFPQAAALSASGFAYLAYASLSLVLPPPTTTTGRANAILQLARLTHNSRTVNGYLLAGLLCIAIAPVTTLAMLPTNFRLIELNEQMGGARSEASAAEAKRSGDQGAGQRRSAEDSVAGEGQAAEFTDLSGPQSRTSGEASGEEEREVQVLLERFSRLNLLRAGLIGAGGVVGLVTALAG